MRAPLPMLLAVLTAAGLAAGAVVASGAATSSSGRPASNAADPVTVATHRYGPYERNLLDVYAVPSPGGAPRAGVLLIHGGSWVAGDKTDLEAQARQLARRGFVVASMNYRYAEQAAWPAQRTDGLRALRYLRAHAARYDLDPDRVVLIGMSAGAHIATALGTYGRGGERVAGVIGLSGPLDMRRTAADPAGGLDAIVTGKLLRCPPAACPGRYDSATPARRLSPGDAPTLLFSARTEWVDPQNSVGFVRTAERKGVDARLVWIPGDVHAWYWDDAWPAIDDFLQDRLLPMERPQTRAD